ncbi:UDP-glucose:glycoprotein glucosyltransferase-domain-containing protein [Fennellomyces sp. T-0311]|nr:UDP-glucose:glycoprotein glucosyltransferase-domain-containing protein [Fennellomyces sp. T-0311]
MRLRAFQVIAALWLHYYTAASATAPPVDLTLVAPWCAPDLAVELLETVSTGNNTAFFNIVDEFINADVSSGKTAQQIYHDALAIVETHLTRPSLAIAKLALAIHSASPRIEAYHQYYRENVKPATSCSDGPWADVGGGRVVCNPNDLVDLDTSYTPELLPFDHVLLQGDTIKSAVVVYTTDLSSKAFADFHKVLTHAATSRPGLAYIVRFMPSKECQQLPLTGYGVELALKKTDYLVIDDREATQGSVKGKLASFGKKISQTLFDENVPSKIEPLTPQEIQDLGLKATQFITKSENPLSTLVQLSQDFPKHGRRISDMSLNKELAEEVLENHRTAPSQNAMWLNGAVVDGDEVDPFALVRALEREQKLIRSFESLEIDPPKAIEIITHPSLAKMEASQGGEPTDVYDVRSDLVLWCNNLEKDKRYKKWSNNLMDMLKPVYPGQLRAIRRNIYNVVMVEDLSTVTGLKRVAEVVEMVRHNTPIRFGILPAVADAKNPATAAAVAMNNLYQIKGKVNALDFLSKLLEQLEGSKQDKASIELIEKAYGGSLAPLIAENKGYLDQVHLFLSRFGIGTNPVMFLNGKLLEHDDVKIWTRVLMMSLGEQTQLMARALYFGGIKADDDVYDYYLTRPYVSVSRNPYITVSEGHPLQMITLDDNRQRPDVLYLTATDASSSTEKDTNVWVVADLDSLAGLKLASEALSFLDENERVRLALIHNGDTPSKNTKISTVLYRELASGNKNIKELVEKAISSHDELLSGTPEQVKMFAPGSPIVESVASTAAHDHAQVLEGLGLEPGFHGLIINGRIVGPFVSDDTFTKDDFTSLLRYESEHRIQPIKEAFVASEATSSQALADVLTRIAAIVEHDKASVQQDVFTMDRPTIRQRPYQSRKGDLTKVTLGDETTAFAQIGVVVDPLSETAQKWSALLETLSRIDGVYIEIHLSPVFKLDEIPLKRFYRYVVDHELQFDATTGALATPMAYFTDLPIDALYTLGVDTIKSWHVTVKEANVDLDNIQLTDNTHISAVYELERILIEGHCVDAANRTPPRGLQFVLGTASTAAMTDTIVMANLGYFQLKAQPGLWNLRVREGRSSEVYHIDSIGTEGNWQSNKDKNTNSKLALTSFEGLTVYPQVRKNPGMESEDVLAESTGSGSVVDQASGIWTSVKQKLFGGEQKDQTTDAQQAKPKQADINIFSVASGHLYERFMSIMIVSVMEHTNSTVKFWFIENFLSPGFKDFVPHLAREYNFDYEMITYKWPSWLRAQKEKQRTIWGYKILFLDVLFPLDLDKVIFVDADQIVRTDLQTLVDLDLHGAPYGYTPFCSDRTEMDGFRFWNQGYWKEHLRDKPYHISALYVIDLVQFRKMAAGDRLRAQYQQLSADPNSLANLDQDLPNNMQNVVPIFSLPQDWLWCETWCSDESLKTAKTIDLCNNPLTKEPKLDRARRQVPEWEGYDEQVDALRKRVAASTQEESAAESSEKVEEKRHIKDEL